MNMKIGILGGGQLARMLALAAYPLGIRTVCIDPSVDACAKDVTNVLAADYADEAQLKAFAEQVDVITFETENIPLTAAECVAAVKPLHPGLPALKTGQDRRLEKNLFKELRIPTPLFFPIDSFADLENAIKKTGLPAVLKTCRFGYDGKGQYVIKKQDDLTKAWRLLGGQALILEQFMPFDRELSLIAVRDQKQQIQFYPLVENQHREGILRLSMAPYLDTALQQQAERYAQALLTHFNYVGVLVIELFQIGAQLFANEMAPRVHNSGHWTIEGAHTSQFENHLRAICGLPLGATDIKGYSAMFNLIGQEVPLGKTLAVSGAHYHAYHKAPKPNRKLGHVTLNADTQEKYQARLAQLKKIIH